MGKRHGEGGTFPESEVQLAVARFSGGGMSISPPTLRAAKSSEREDLRFGAFPAPLGCSKPPRVLGGGNPPRPLITITKRCLLDPRVCTQLMSFVVS